MLRFFEIIIWGFQFKGFAWIFGEANCEIEFSNKSIDLARAREVSRAIRTMSKYTFWESKCLAQVYAAKLMLRRRKQRCTVYVGVAK